MLRYIAFAGPHRAMMVTASLPSVADGEALVRTTLTGISAGTERMWYEGSAGALRSGRKNYPYRPGYELIGRIAATGNEFRGVKAGERVFAMKPHASHAVLGPDDLWFPLADDINDEDALGTALCATALHAMERADLAACGAIAVAGLGALGLIMLQVLAASGATAIGLTRDPQKAALAIAHGAGTAFTYDEFAETRLPIHCVFECSGVAANVARLQFFVRPRGEIVLAGFYTEPVVLDGEAMHARELTVKAVRGGGRAGESEREQNFERAAALVAAGKVRTGALVTHRFDADSFDDAYRLIADRQGGGALQVCLDWGRE
jgi:bacteriochlorophyllide a dehydrogenase